MVNENHTALIRIKNMVQRNEALFNSNHGTDLLYFAEWFEIMVRNNMSYFFPAQQIEDVIRCTSACLITKKNVLKMSSFWEDEWVIIDES